MTHAEKLEAIKAFCANHECDECPINTSEIPCRTLPANDHSYVDRHYDILFGATPTPCAVDHPGHYNREGAMECIKEMVLIFGVEETMSFCKLNAWKYRYRAADKGGLEDLKKSDNYLRMYEKLKGGECL